MTSSIGTRNLCFTFEPDRKDEWPKPFVSAARSVLLCARADPAVLILGYGLGAMGSLMAELRPRARILGVEISAALVGKARASLPASVTLEQADAYSFLRKGRNRFDLVLDDCFHYVDGNAERPPELRGHAALIDRRLSPGGFYVRNHLPTGSELERAEIADIDACFESVKLRRFRDWDNVLVVACHQPIGRPEMAKL